MSQLHPTMHQCTGCSRLFRFELSTGQCQPCSESVEKPRSEWTLCIGCGHIYPFLERDNDCEGCVQSIIDHFSSSECILILLCSIERLSKAMPPPQENLIIKNAARYAMSHPANPRTHSSKENPHRGHYFNPHVTLGKDLAVSQSTWAKVRISPVHTAEMKSILTITLSACQGCIRNYHSNWLESFTSTR